MATTLEELQVLITAKTQGFKKEIEGIKSQMGGVQGSVNKSMGGITSAFGQLKKVLATVAIGKYVKDSINSAMQVESSLNQIKRTMGESSQQYLKWANDQASAFGMGKAEAIKYGAIYSNLISGFSKNTAETTKRTQDLMQASAIVASATGRTMEDTMERIRSGLLGNTESIEDLGINVNVAMLESTNAFKKFAGDKSWDQLSFQTQQQIRLMAILEQTNTKYGNSLANTTATQMMMFRAELSNLKLALGNAFLPIVQTVLPLLTTLVQGLQWVVNAVSSFIRALFGIKSSQQQGAANANAMAAANVGAGNAMGDMGDKADKAGKKVKKAGQDAKGALAAFDEVNQLNMNQGGAGSEDGGSGGGGADTSKVGTMPSVDMGDTGLSTMGDEASKLADKIRGAFEGLAAWFTKMGDLFSPGLNTLKNMFKQDFEDIKTFARPLESAFEDIGKRWIESVNFRVPIIADAFNAIAPVIDGVHRQTFDTLVKNAQPFADNVKRIFIGAFDFGDAVYPSYVSTIQKLLELILPIMGDISARILQVFFDAFDGLSKVFEAALKPLETVFVTVFTNITNWLDTNNASIVSGFSTAFDDIQIRVTGAIQGIRDESIRIFTDLNKWFVDNSALINKTLTGTWDTIRDNLKDIWTIISTIAFDIWDTLSDFLKDNVDKIHEMIMTTWDVLAKGLMGIWNGILRLSREIFGQLAQWFTDNTGDIKQVLTDTWDTIWKIIEPIWRIINDVGREIFGALETFFDDNSKKIGDFITTAWDTLWKIIKPLWEDILKVAKFIFGELTKFWDTWGKDISKSLGDVFKGISAAFGGALDVITGAFKLFQGVFTGDWKKAWEGIQQTFKGVWDGLGGIVKAAMNVVITVVNIAVSAINDALSIEIPDWDILPDSIQGKKFSMSIPKIPMLATGGIVSSATLAMIGEGSEPEAVTPLSKLNNMITEGVFNALSLRGQFAQPQQQILPDGDLILQVGEDTLGRIAKKALLGEDIRTGSQLIIQTI